MRSPRPTGRRHGRAAALALALIGFAASTAHAQQLSTRQYNVASGLAHDFVTSVLQDSRGYLWAGTFEGVSRFDGYRFVSYDTADGLGSYVVNALAEDRRGRLWVATNGGGISLLNDEPGHRPRFSSYMPGPGAAVNVNVMAVDAAGRLWCGTDAGVYVADVTGATPIFTLLGYGHSAVIGAAPAGDGVWVAINGVGVIEYRGTTPVVHPVPWRNGERMRRIIADNDGAIVVASEAGLFRLFKGAWTLIPVDLRPQQVMTDLLPDGHGGFWLATDQGLLHQIGSRTLRYSLDRVLGGQLSTIAADRSGNLWVGVVQSGLVRIRSRQIFSYRGSEGLPDADVTALLEDNAGGLYSITRTGAASVITDERVSALGAARSASQNRPLAAGANGDWWALSRDGVYHVPGTAPSFERSTRLPLDVHPAVNLPSSVPLAHVDALGRLWFATREPALYRVTDPASASRRVDKWPVQTRANLPLAVLGMDPGGGVWLGHMAMLARFANGATAVIEAPAGLPNLQPRAFMVDRAGGVWIGLRFGGVMMTKNPSAPTPEFRRYSTAQGLSSDTVWAIAEGHDGSIYLGTGRGLDQLDPVSGRVRHFSSDDGLAGNVINHIKVDRSGTVWVATMGGISRLDLSFAPSQAAPVPIYISGIQLAGVEQGLPERGAARVPDLELAASGRHLRIEFVSPSFQESAPIRYQYMLAGVDADWSTPAQERTVNYATLAAGRYRFQVRAVTEDGRTSVEPAIVEFVIHPPFWARSWFTGTLLAVALAGGVGVRRLRHQRRRGLEAIRRQVATDLHDDVGSGLAQIAILSEVVKRQAGSDTAPALNEVAELARSLRDSMSDIVWAVSPSRDAPIALVERMRQVTFNLLSSSTEVAFHAPEDREMARLDLTPDRRRHVLLIFKETITNIARHAAATVVAIHLSVETDRLLMTIRDDGAGFDPQRRRAGNGLENLAARARSIGGALTIDSSPGGGTLTTLSVPLRRRTRMFRWLPRRMPPGYSGRAQ